MSTLSHIICMSFGLMVLLVYIPTSANSLTSEQRFCNEPFLVATMTSCHMCLILYEGRSHCPGDSEYDGTCDWRLRCKHSCFSRNAPKCCKGYYGSNCLACPGGASSPCNGRGTCADGMDNNGSCKCLPRFKGTACELCRNENNYGKDCNKVCLCMNGECQSGSTGDGSCECYGGYRGHYCEEVIPGCANKKCLDGSKCFVANGSVSCMCKLHYIYDETVHKCKGVNPCKSNPCSVHANCTSISLKVHNCTCQHGYQGDGIVCVPINNCDINNGGCDNDCVYIGPGRHTCICARGYKNRPNGTCELIDLCRHNSTCDKNADCRMTGSMNRVCMCRTGYVGNGTFCEGNLLQRMAELNASHPILKNRISRALRSFSTHYSEALTQSGPFTMFVPTDSAFKKLPHILMNQSLNLKQVLRRHVLGLRLTILDLFDSTRLYTLEATPVRMQARGDRIRFFTRASRMTATLVVRDIRASNGIIHVIDMLLATRTDHYDSLTTSAYEMTRHPRRKLSYSMFIQFLQMTGLNKTLAKEQNITVLRVSDSGMSQLSHDVLEYLNHTKGLPTLMKIMQNHIFYNKMTLADLMSRDKVVSSARITTAVRVAPSGQVTLGNSVNIIHADIIAQNAVLHDIDSLLLPQSMHGNILPRTCSVVSYKTVWTLCKMCRYMHFLEQCPRRRDKHLKIHTCQHIGRMSLCQHECKRPTVKKDCCRGFYSSECRSCPGGFLNPCNGNGKCQDKMHGKGNCVCKANFTGVACEQCSRKDYYGLDCTTKCTCLHGICATGPAGTGKCYLNTCQMGYKGDNCDTKTTPCRQSLSRIVFCDAHAVCLSSRSWHGFLTVRCKCRAGYEGNGIICDEINSCAKADACHLQARCMKTGPGTHDCECNPGFTGDGKTLCIPFSQCSQHTDCHENATCRPTTPAKYLCMCNDGYHGNGTYCSPTNMCLVDNGGCHYFATCVYVAPQERNCTCPPGFFSDGVNCYSTIDVEIGNHPNLTELSHLLRTMTNDSDLLHDTSATYTFFAPSNAAVTQFKTLAEYTYWTKAANIAIMISYHTVLGTRSIGELVEYTKLADRVDTIREGFSLNISAIGKNLYVNGALVLEADIPAFNGYIHIIDKVLEPYPLDSVDQRPSLSQLFDRYPQYTLFKHYLMQFHLLERMENLQTSYTLFLLTNDSLNAYRSPITHSFLTLYIVPAQILAHRVDRVQYISTIAGQYQKICLDPAQNKSQFTVNGVELDMVNLLTEGGIAHGLNTTLPPMVRQCNNDVTYHQYGECVDCNGNRTGQCPSDFSPINGAHKTPTSCMLSDGVISYYGGCQRLCSMTTMKEGCCHGFYGSDCKACPGGPLNECSGNGLCKGGKTGTGECLCMGNYEGVSCELCQAWYTGEHCNITKTPCTVNNGGCGEHAFCSLDSNRSQVVCQCLYGYKWGGTECRLPCYVNNGGCVANATCHESDGHIICSCDRGFIGYGDRKCTLDIGLCAVKNGGCEDTCKIVGLREEVVCSCPHGGVPYRGGCNKMLIKTLIKLHETRNFIMAAIDQPTFKLYNAVVSHFNRAHINTTVFAPNIHTIEGMLTYSVVLNHMVQGRVVLNETSWPKGGKTIMSRSNKPLLIERDAYQFYVNKIPVITANIPATNGIIHIIAASLSDDNFPERNSLASSSSAKKHTIVGATVGMLCAVILVCLIVAVVLYARRRGFLSISRAHKSMRLESTGSVTALHPDADKDESQPLHGAPVTTNFDNPLYQISDI